MINDPILIKHSQDHWWLSIADTDVVLWAKGLATGYGFDVQVHEPDIWPLAVQGPKAEELVTRVFGEGISSIGFFRGEWKKYYDTSLYIARSGWSKQGGFEIYVNDFSLGEKLWDDFFEKGRDLNVGAGCPNLIERIESGLLSFGADATYETTPFECGLEQYVSLEADIESLSINALRKQKPKTRLVGLVVKDKIDLADRLVLDEKEVIGEITANTWSPRYSVYLAYARCDFNRIEVLKELNVKSTSGLVKAKITDLPFNFAALGLSSQS
jgi:dimethylsulfoniopropionate demethylase